MHKEVFSIIFHKILKSDVHFILTIEKTCSVLRFHKLVKLVALYLICS
jgi:hypothetical protein